MGPCFKLFFDWRELCWIQAAAAKISEGPGMGVSTLGKPVDRSPNVSDKKASPIKESTAKKPQKHLLDHVNVGNRKGAGEKVEEDENM